MFQHLKIDILKIDKGFLIQKEDKEKNRIILESITNLCHRLGIKTVAEGVETQEDINLMKELNCDQMQGYYYGKPMPLLEFKNRCKNK